MDIKNIRVVDEIKLDVCTKYVIHKKFTFDANWKDVVITSTKDVFFHFDLLKTLHLNLEIEMTIYMIRHR